VGHTEIEPVLVTAALTLHLSSAKSLSGWRPRSRTREAKAIWSDFGELRGTVFPKVLDDRLSNTYGFESNNIMRAAARSILAWQVFALFSRPKTGNSEIFVSLLLA
jgi:hypothetical protein